MSSILHLGIGRGISFRIRLACAVAITGIALPTNSMVIGQQTENPELVKAAANMLHPPFSSWNEQREAIGIEVDIVNDAAKSLGRSVVWSEMDFGNLFDAIDDGKIDVAVSTIGITEKRRAKVAFSDPYFVTEIVALVAPNSNFSTLEQLANARIGADRSTTSFQAAIKRWTSATLIGQVKEGSTWPKMIRDGEIDAFVVDASDQERLESLSNVVLRRIKRPLKEERFAVAMTKDDPELLAAINRSVKHYLPAAEIRIGGEFQLTTPVGTKLFSQKSPSQKLVVDYFKAKNELLKHPESADAAIWIGRRAGYLGRMNEAINIFSAGIEKHPSDARLFRHRGHRYISTRQFDKAIADLERAARLIENTEDKIEPDGAPNELGIPLTTTHGNIWYHLGLAYYLKNDLPNALRCFSHRIDLQKNDDNTVANGHWLYMIHRQMGNLELANASIREANANMKIIENKSYHKMCLFYNGTIQRNDVDDQTSGKPNEDVLLYGLGNWYLYDQNNKSKAKEMFERLFQNGSPFSFAYIAAESDYVRIFGKRTTTTN